MQIALVGRGLVGSELLRQVHGHERFAIVAITSSKRMVLAQPGSNGLSPDSPFEEDLDLDSLDAFLASRTGIVVVDCSSSSEVAARYPAWLRAGFSVATPNKKAFSSSMDLYRDIKSISSATIRYEATVGYQVVSYMCRAGLPIISTLQDLLATRDSVKKIEGIFSGTLSYIFNTFSSVSSPSSSLKFSEIVNDAKRQGFTEPDPRDDLNDVARKVVILARECGLDVSIDSLDVLENIVPEPLRALNAQDFMHRLAEFDGHFDAMNGKARDSGHVLRYVGVIDLEKGGICRVECKQYPKNHPFASLKGSDNIISFHTERFSPQPLIVQGPGAGAAVTAFGVFADILKCKR